MQAGAAQPATNPEIGDPQSGEPPTSQQALAWKNGLFAFSTPTCLPSCANYRAGTTWTSNTKEKYPKTKQFNGKIGKTLTLDQVLKILTKTQVHYSIEGNQLTIRP